MRISKIRAQNWYRSTIRVAGRFYFGVNLAWSSLLSLVTPACCSGNPARSALLSQSVKISWTWEQLLPFFNVWCMFVTPTVCFLHVKSVFKECVFELFSFLLTRLVFITFLFEDGQASGRDTTLSDGRVARSRRKLKVSLDLFFSLWIFWVIWLYLPDTCIVCNI